MCSEIMNSKYKYLKLSVITNIFNTFILREHSCCASQIIKKTNFVCKICLQLT